MHGREWWCRPGRLLLPPLAGFACLLALPGCDRRDDSVQSVPASRRVVTTGPAGTGVIRGVVSFKGAAPEAEEIEGARCHAGAGTIRVGPVEVRGDGTLKGVMVYVKNPPTVPAGDSESFAVLDQVNCQYVPRVIGVRAGQVIRVKNSDPALHNVHALTERNPTLNFGMTRAGESRDVTFERAEQFTVKCDVHPWMSAKVYVFDHPFFAPTGDDGRFEITGLPPGEHEVVFSHPFLGERARQVKVGDGTAAPELDVTFKKGQ